MKKFTTMADFSGRNWLIYHDETLTYIDYHWRIAITSIHTILGDPFVLYLEHKHVEPNFNTQDRVYIPYQLSDEFMSVMFPPPEQLRSEGPYR